MLASVEAGKDMETELPATAKRAVVGLTLDF